MKPAPPLAVIALLLTACIRLAQAQETPEQAVLQYFDAERAGNWSAVAHLIHPVALHQSRASIELILETPAADTILRQAFGAADVRTLSDSAVYVGLMEWVSHNSDEVRGAIRAAQLETVGHVMEGGDTAHVVYRLRMPVQGASYATTQVLSVARWARGWRVLPEIDQAWVAAILRQLADTQVRPRPQEAAAPLAAGLALYRQNKLQPAGDSLERAVQLDPTNADALLYLAETRRRLFKYDESVALARRALARSPCSSFAHTVLGMAYHPVYSELVQASVDSAWSHLVAAVRCDSTDGNAWMGLQEEAMYRGDTALERHARRRLMAIGFFSPGALEHGRWLLESLPPRALLLTDGNLETHTTLALQLVEGLRTDVAVVNLWLLHLPWYARLVRERYGVPLYLDDASLDVAWQTGRFSIADSIVCLWRLAEERGTPGRPIAFAPMVDLDPWVKKGPGRYRLAGAYWAMAPVGDTLVADTARVRVALSAARARGLGGPASGVGDRSPTRLAEPDGKYAQFAVYAWTVYVYVLADAGRVAEARHSFGDLLAFVQAANLRDTASLRLLEDTRVRLQLEH